MKNKCTQIEFPLELLEEITDLRVLGCFVTLHCHFSKSSEMMTADEVEQILSEKWDLSYSAIAYIKAQLNKLKTKYPNM